MLRPVLCAFTTLSLCLAAGGVTQTGDDKAKDKKGLRAKITSIDAKGNTITVKTTGADGKEAEKTLKLARTVRYFDSTGKVIAADVFRSGDTVLVVEVAGQVQEIRQDRGKDGDAKSGDTKKDTDRKKKDADRKKDGK